MLFRRALAWSVLALPVFADQFDTVRDVIRARMMERQVPSITVALSRDGKILWEEGFGWADRENLVAANEHTMYSLASISKPFTATALMTLVEKKFIDLDHPVNEYLGNAKVRARVGNADDATVRRVANHTAGLPIHGSYFPTDGPARAPSMDDTIRRYGNLVTAPGEQWEYTNLGYAILGRVISRVSGQSYEDYMRQAVFLKLGLTHTSVGVGAGLEKFAAVRYGNDGLPLPHYEVDHPGAAAIYSSAHDLIRFAMFHLKDHLPDQLPILSDASIDEMHRPSVMTGQCESCGYGIGWISHDLVGYPTINHTGAMPGVSTMIRLVPSENTAVVVLCNVRDSQFDLPREVVDNVLAAVLPKYRLPPAAARSKAVAFQPPPALLGKWAGSISTYDADIPMTMDVLPSGEVQARLSGGFNLPTLLSGVTWNDNTLSGVILGDFTTEYGQGPYYLNFSLKLRDNLLNGSVIAVGPSGTPPFFAKSVAEWVELKKN